MFQGQHVKYRKDTSSRTKVLSWWISCYFSPVVTAALTQFNIFTGLKCFSKPVTDALFSKTGIFNRRSEPLLSSTLQKAKQMNYPILQITLFVIHVDQGPAVPCIAPFNKQNKLLPTFTVIEQPVLTSQNKSWFQSITHSGTSGDVPENYSEQGSYCPTQQQHQGVLTGKLMESGKRRRKQVKDQNSQKFISFLWSI